MRLIADPNEEPPSGIFKQIIYHILYYSKAIIFMMFASIIPMGGVEYLIGLFPSISGILTGIQIICALLIFVIGDAMVPVWAKVRIPGFRRGARSRAETYIKWRAWYSMN